MSLKLKKIATLIATVLVLAVPTLTPATTLAACGNNNIQSQINNGINTASGSTGSCSSQGNIQSGIGSLAKTVVNILSLVVGIVAVIMIIYAGFRYITSGGDSNHVSSAKNSLIYAIVGLVIVALSQLIVHWVLNTSSNITGSAEIIRRLL